MKKNLDRKKTVLKVFIRPKMSNQVHIFLIENFIFSFHSMLN